MNIKRFLVSGIVIWMVNSVIGCLTCGKYFNWVYQLPPNIWKKPCEIMFIENMTGAYLFSLFGALAFVLVFVILYKGIPGRGVGKGISYGFLMWFVGALIGIGSMTFYMKISIVVISYWIVLALVMSLIDGIIAGAIYKEK